MKLSAAQLPALVPRAGGVSVLEDALPGSEGQEQVNTQKVFPKCGQGVWFGFFCSSLSIAGTNISLV